MRRFLFFSFILLVNLNTLSYPIKEEDCLRRIRLPNQEIILKWVKESDPLVPILDYEEYINFLEKMRSKINPQGEPGKVVYYPGIGPFGIYLNLTLPLLATDCNLVVSVDIGQDITEPLTLENFKRWVMFSLRPLIEKKIILEEEIKFEVGEDNKFSFSFPFKGRERKFIIYYKKDAGKFFPPELEQGFDVLITRWIPKGFKVQEEIENKWLTHLREDGFIITTTDGDYLRGEDKDLLVSSDFWKNFTLILEAEGIRTRNMFLFRRKSYRP